MILNLTFSRAACLNMDPTDRYLLTVDASSVRDLSKFTKGVVVFELPGDVKADGGDHSKTGDTSKTDNTSKILPELGSIALLATKVARCHICNSADHVKAACPQKESMVECRFCGERGHRQRECPTKPAPTCKNCGTEGHVKADCPVITCLRCGEQGHKRAACPSKGKERANCKHCGSTGHPSGDCTVDQNTTKPKADDDDPNPRPLHEHWQSASSSLTHPPPNGFTSIPSSPAPPATGDSQNVEWPIDGNAATKPAATSFLDREGPLPVPNNVPELPTSEILSVKLRTEVQECHITSCSLQFDVSFTAPESATGLAHRSAIVRFTTRNMIDLTIRRIRIGDRENDGGEEQEQEQEQDAHIDTIGHLLSTGQRQQATSICASNEDSALYHIQLTFNPASKDGLLGEYFYADGDFGPFTYAIHKIRDALLEASAAQPVSIHFFTVQGAWLPEHIQDVQISLAAQRTSDPLTAWYPNRRPNIQLGMQLDPKERPTYKLPPRLQFDSLLEYVTVHFNHLVASLEDTQDLPVIETSVRLVQFEGGGDRLYLGAIEMRDGLNLRPDSTAQVSFLGQDASSETKWRACVIDGLPFVHGYDHTVFLFRPRVGAGFADEPDFERRHVLKAKDYANSTDLSHALNEMRGIKCFVREETSTAGIKAELNALRILWQHQDAFRREIQVILGNNFKQTDETDYFAADVARYGEATVQTALDRACDSLALDDKQREGIRALRKMKAGVMVYHGPGGTGKTTILRCLVLYQYRVSGTVHPCALWVVSPLNHQLDDLAEMLSELLERERQAMIAAGESPRHWIVLRRHMRETEAKIWKQKAQKAREEAGVDRVPDYLNHDSIDRSEDGSEDGSSDEEMSDADEPSDKEASDADELSDKEASDADELSNKEASDADEPSNKEMSDADEPSDKEASDADELSDKEASDADELSNKEASDADEPSNKEMSDADEPSDKEASDADEPGDKEMSDADETGDKEMSDADGPKDEDLTEPVEPTETKATDVDKPEDTDLLVNTELDPVTDEDVQLQEILSTARFIYNVYTSSRSTGHDKRMRKVELSEGQWLLRFVGVPDASGERHPIAHPDPSRYAEFRNQLDAYARGEEMTPEDKSNFKLCANRAMRDLAKEVDVVLESHHVLTQPRSYLYSQARACHHDEAGRPLEPSSLSSLLFSRPQTGDDTDWTTVGDPVPQVFYGDILQPNPETAGGNTDLPFKAQQSTSLFQRLMMCGADKVEFDVQHRYPSDIAKVINAVLPLGRIRTGPEVDELPRCVRAKEVIGRLFPKTKHTSTVFLAKRGVADKSPTTQSSYNLELTDLSTWTARQLVLAGVPGSSIAIGAGYVFEVRQTRVSLHNIARYFASVPRLAQFAQQVLDIVVCTIDGIQGGEVDYFILDTVVSGKLGFMADTARILLALSRAKAALFIVGNPKGVEEYYRDNNQMRRFYATAYYKTVKYYTDNGLLIDIDRLADKRGKPLSNPVPVREALERLYARREESDPITAYIRDVDHDISELDDGDGAEVNDGNGDGLQADSSWNGGGGGNSGWAGNADGGW
ncbi:hypothetical protein N0V90_012804 [Kalmusia sp. IMI 367209]|nr:hypothetical protein N0V90_012804 [Kalmusia sp. IMI 367209]